MAMRLELYVKPKKSTPAPVGDLSLHASKKTTYQSNSWETCRQLARCSDVRLLRTDQGRCHYSH